jgi:hypothetical protein
MLRAADEQGLDLVAGLGVAFTALLRAIVSARNASTSPSRSFGTALA